MAAIPVTAKVYLPTLRLKLDIMPGWRFRIWLATRIIILVGWVYGRPVELEVGDPKVEF